MTRKKITLGIFGFGCVGQGLHDVLSRTNGLKAQIKKICIKNSLKERSLAPSLFTANRDEILFDDEIDVIVELINDDQAAFEIVKTAMENGKSVVSASKKMIANHLPELTALQEKYGVSFLYEGACCASIPIIRNLEEYYDNDLLHALKGIFNGSTNYILTKIFDEKKTYHEALHEAQELGFAETDPKMDVEGFDPKYKLCILLYHAFGIYIQPELIFNFGISRLNDFDIRYAIEKKSTIKLLAVCRKINNRVVAYVLPHFVNRQSKLFSVTNEYNAVIVESAFADQQVFTGKGAGSTPTGTAVLSDISALTYGYKYEYRKRKQLKVRSRAPAFAVEYAYNENEPLAGQLNEETLFCNHVLLKVYVRYNRDSDIMPEDFEEIEERYSSASFQFICGYVRLETLAGAAWIENENISIIVFE